MEIRLPIDIHLYIRRNESSMELSPFNKNQPVSCRHFLRFYTSTDELLYVKH